MDCNCSKPKEEEATKAGTVLIFGPTMTTTGVVNTAAITTTTWKEEEQTVVTDTMESIRLKNDAGTETMLNEQYSNSQATSICRHLLVGPNDEEKKQQHQQQQQQQQQKEALARLLSNNDVLAYGIFPLLSSTHEFVSLADTCRDLKVLVTQENAIVHIIRRKDIWMTIFSFVGPGHHIYVSSVCKNFKTFYKAYFASLPRNEIPVVRNYERNPADYLEMIIANIPPPAAVSTSTFYSSAFSNLDCFRLAYEHGIRWDEMTCAKLARGGHLDCLQYARQNSCPWNEHTCAYAAIGGSLAVLKWLREQDHPCPWSDVTCYYALGAGNLHCFNYAIQNDCPPPLDRDYEEASDAGASIIQEGGRQYLVLQEQEEDIRQLQQLDDLSTFYEALLVAHPIAGREMIREVLREDYNYNIY